MKKVAKVAKILLVVLVAVWFWYNTPMFSLGLKAEWDEGTQTLHVRGFWKNGLSFRMGGSIEQICVGVRTATGGYIGSEAWKPSLAPIQRINVTITGVPNGVEQVTLEFVVRTPYGMLISGDYWEIPLK